MKKADFKISGGKKIMVLASSHKMLISYLKNMHAWITKHNLKKNDIILCLLSNCGCSREYKKFKDIPKKSAKCKHGTYFIKYGKK